MNLAKAPGDLNQIPLGLNKMVMFGSHPQQKHRGTLCVVVAKEQQIVCETANADLVKCDEQGQTRSNVSANVCRVKENRHVQQRNGGARSLSLCSQVSSGNPPCCSCYSDKLLI